jgi:hypothetical protein
MFVPTIHFLNFMKPAKQRDFVTMKVIKKQNLGVIEFLRNRDGKEG